MSEPTQTQPQRGRSWRIKLWHKRPVQVGKCYIVTAEEFLKCPSEAANMAAEGTQLCIRAGHAKIIVGPRAELAQHKVPTLIQRLQAKIDSTFRRSKEPLDVTWLE